MPAALPPEVTIPAVEVLATLLDVSLTGTILLRPVPAPDGSGAIQDFAYVHLNPAAQRMLQLPAQPAGTMLTLFPGTVAVGSFQFFCDTYRSGRPGQFAANHQLDGLDNYYRMQAQRAGELLVLSFTDTADQDRSAVELALRESQAREQAARAEAEAQRQQLHTMFMQAPAIIGITEGPQHIYQFVNPLYQATVGGRPLLGCSVADALPELVDQGIIGLLDEVYRTGVPFQATEMPVRLSHAHDEGPAAELEERYYNFVYQPSRNAAGVVSGIVVFAYDISAQVLARQQLQQLNQELEVLVFERTRALRHAQAETEAQARQLLHFTESLPSTTFTVEASGRVPYISPQWYAYTGMAPGTPVAELWPTLLHPDDLPAVAREFGAALAEGRAWRYEFRLRGADGHYRWFDSQGVPEPLADAEAAGRPRRWYGSNLDIDDLKQAQLRLEQQEQQLTDILSSLPAGVVTFDAEELRYTFFNDTFQQQVQGRAVLGRRLTELFPEAEEQGFVALLRQVLDTGQPYVVHELPSFLRDPHTGAEQLQFTDVAYVPLRQNAAAPTYGVLSYSIDTTERVLTRRQAQEADQRLRLLTESLPLVVYTTGPQGNTTYLSPQWWAYTGQEPAHLDPIVNWIDAVHPEELPALGRSFHETAARAETWEAELRLRRHDGQYRWHLSRAVPQLDEATGVVVAWHGSLTDIHELHEARAALQAERQQLTSILSQVPAAVSTFVGPDHRYAFFNSTHQRLFGGRAWLGGSISEIYPEVVPQGFVGLLDEVYTTGRPFAGTDMPATVEVDGQTQQYYIDFVYQPMPDAQGQNTGILAFAVDVTERVLARRQAEEAQALALAAAQQAAAQRETFFQIFEQTPAAIALLRGPDYRFEYANSAYHGLFPDRPLLGRFMVEVFPETAEQGFVALLDHVYQTGETYLGQEVKFTAAPVAGQPPQDTYYDITYQAVWEGEAVVGISVFAFDVTERLRARQEREIQRRRLHDLFMQAPAAICILDGPELVYELVNPVYQSLFPGRILSGHAIADVFPELAGTGVVETFQRVYQTGTANEERAILIPFANPATGQLEDRYFNYIQQARYDEQGHIDGVLVFAFEVTEQVLARRVLEEDAQRAQLHAAQLAAANQRLTRANAELDTFVYTASHDLKTPISNIEGLVAALREDLALPAGEQPDPAALLDLMQGSVDRFKHTLAHLADVTRLQQMLETTETAAPVALAPLVEAVCQDLRPQLLATRAELAVNVAAAPVVAFAEPHLRSIVYNLLSNSLKYRHPARPLRVHLRTRLEGNYTVLEVEDNGLGFDPAQQAKVFGLFQRLHDHVPGSGVGLYAVRKILDNAGGRIEADGQPELGATFRVYFPL